MPSTEITKIFADRLSDLIAESKEKQELFDDLSRETGIPKSSLSYYQNDKREPNITNLVRLANHFNVTTDYLLGLSEIRKPDMEIQAIALKTGLSEAAIDGLIETLYAKKEYEALEQEHNKVPIKEGFVRLANFLLEDYPVFHAMAITFSEYYELMKGLRCETQTMSAKEGFEHWKRAELLEGTESQAVSKGELAEFKLYCLVRDFERIIASKTEDLILNENRSQQKKVQ